MSKKQTSSSTSTINYDPASLSAYHTAIGTAMPVLQGYANNPFGNPFFLNQLTSLTNQANRAGQNSVSNLMNNFSQGGFAGQNPTPFLQSQLLRSGRATSGLTAAATQQAIQNAFQNQQFSLGTLSGFQPLLTGQATTGTTSQSGLGTWLPQLAGGLLGGGLSWLGQNSSANALSSAATANGNAAAAPVNNSGINSIINALAYNQLSQGNGLAGTTPSNNSYLGSIPQFQPNAQSNPLLNLFNPLMFPGLSGVQQGQ